MFEAFPWSQLHFLRPAWLLLLLPTALLYAVVNRRTDPTRQWKGLIAPRLLQHLVVGGEHTFRFRPIHLVTALLAIGTIAVAGPTWTRQQNPFAEDTAPLVVVLDVSESMNAIDVSPTRLERAKHKIRDVLQGRAGARSALIAYAGTSHQVMPLTEDGAILTTYLMALDPAMMPVPGNDAAAALKQARQLLNRQETPGTILLLTDGLDEDALAEIGRQQAQDRDQLIVLGVGTTQGGPIRVEEGRFATDARGQRRIARLDRASLEAAAGIGAFVATATVDERDVERIIRATQSHLESVANVDQDSPWEDSGYFLLFPTALLALFWYRRGWTVEWN